MDADIYMTHGNLIINTESFIGDKNGHFFINYMNNIEEYINNQIENISFYNDILTINNLLLHDNNMNQLEENDTNKSEENDTNQLEENNMNQLKENNKKCCIIS